MGFLTLLLIAVGLSLDALAVAAARGFSVRSWQPVLGLRLALAFGIFQMIMPVLGWGAGLRLRGLIAGADHWLAFLLLAGIGGKMIWESFSREALGASQSDTGFLIILGLALATSIDALAVGLSFSLLRFAIFPGVLLIGLVTFIFSLAGFWLGHRFGSRLGKRLEALGGLVLFLIGLRILLTHLFEH